MKKWMDWKDGEQLPVLGQGTWHMGDNGQSRKEELSALRRGIELGMTVIDTAELYGNGRSEQLVGEAIAGIREKVFLISKVLPSHANRRGTQKACEESLRRLNTGYLDLYLLHWQGRIPLEETVEAMLALRQQGKIRAWGVSNFDVAPMKRLFRIEGGDTCAANEILYNLTRRGIEYDLSPWSRQQHMPLIAYSPVEQGRLAMHPLLAEIAIHYEATPAQIALAWVVRRPGILAIPKAATVKHVEENYRSLSIRLDRRDLARLDQAFPPPQEKKKLEMI